MGGVREHTTKQKILSLCYLAVSGVTVPIKATSQ